MVKRRLLTSTLHAARDWKCLRRLEFQRENGEIARLGTMAQSGLF